MESAESETTYQGQSLTEMVLYMKGPIYSVADRASMSSGFGHRTLKHRAYMTNATSDQFFRQPKQDYESLKLINPSIQGKWLQNNGW